MELNTYTERTRDTAWFRNPGSATFRGKNGFMQMSAGKIVRVTAFFDTIKFTDFWKRIAQR